MRFYVIKDLTNELYLAGKGVYKYATYQINNAKFYKDKDRALADLKSPSLIWKFLKGLDLDPMEVTPDMFRTVVKTLNLKVIPIEIIEDCYIE